MRIFTSNSLGALEIWIPDKRPNGSGLNDFLLHQAVVHAQPEHLRLTGSLTQQFIRLINDLKAGRYDHDPLQGDAAIRKYYGILQVALLDALPIE